MLCSLDIQSICFQGGTDSPAPADAHSLARSLPGPRTISRSGHVRIWVKVSVLALLSHRGTRGNRVFGLLTPKGIHTGRLPLLLAARASAGQAGSLSLSLLNWGNENIVSWSWHHCGIRHPLNLRFNRARAFP